MIHRRLVHRWLCDDGGAHCIWDMTWSHVTKVEKIEMRLGSMDWLQVWRASQRLWTEGPRVTVKLEQDLAPMDQGNSEEQVRSRSMNQYGHVMIWSGSYHLWLIGACVASTSKKMGWNAQGKGITYRAFHFSGLSWIEKCLIGLRIDNRTIKRGNL